MFGGITDYPRKIRKCDNEDVVYDVSQARMTLVRHSPILFGNNHFIYYSEAKMYFSGIRTSSK